MSTPAVSVVMPVLDGALTVRSAIESVLDQSWRDFELIVIDDGSQDATPELLAAVVDPRVRVLRNARNIGIPRTLQRAIDAARAPLLARLDADDRWHADYLARQLATLERQGDAVMVSCWTREVDADGREVGASEPSPLPGFVAWELTHRNSLYPSATVVRSDAVRAVGGIRPEFTVAEDHDLWTRLVMAGGRCVVCPEKLVDYRRAGDGVTATTPSPTRRRLGLEVRRAYVTWLLARDVGDPEVAALWELMSWAPLSAALRGPALRGALVLAMDLTGAASARLRLPARSRRAIRSRLAQTLLHHAWQLVSSAPRDAACLARAALVSDLGSLRRHVAWTLWLAIARQQLAARFQPTGSRTP